MEHEEEFPEVFLNQKETLNVTKAEQECSYSSSKDGKGKPEIGGIVFNLPTCLLLEML